MGRGTRSPIAAHDFARDDRGDTLVEILIAVVVIGMAVTAMLGALLTTTTASVDHRSTATISAALASFAQAAEHTVELDSFNGSGTGPSFTTACPANYQIIGNPMPSRGPVGTQIAVLGTPSSLANLGSATFGGAPDPSSTTTGSTSTGAIALMTVPSEPAGSYELTPFDGTDLASSAFTVTPSLDAMTPAGASTGAGSTVNVGVHGFAANATLTVTIGSTTLPSAEVSGNPIGPDGSGTISFTIPNPLPTGDSVAQYVTISDGTNNADPVVLNLGADTAPPTPVATSSPFDNGYFKLTSSVQYWNAGSWTPACPGTNSNIQQLTFSLTDSQPGNGAGGNTSVVVGNLTAQTSPVPAPNLTATAPASSSGELELLWDTPTYSGSSAVTGYRLFRSGTATMPANPFQTVGPTPTSFSDTGLLVGNKYYYWIETVTTSGTSEPSPAVLGTTLPGTPIGLTPTRGDTQETLTWSAPSPNGDAPITSYNIYWNTTDSKPTSPQASVDGSQTTYTNTGLTNGTTYYYWVSAVNAGGESIPASTFGTPATAPTVPLNFIVNPNNTPTQLVLNWSAPTSNGGLPITYNLYRSTSDTSQPTTPYQKGLTTTTYTDQTLTTGQTYTYWVTAENAAGESPAAGPSSYQAGAPGPPQNLTASGKCTGNGKTCQDTLKWSAPSANGGSSIVSYNIYISTTGTRPGAPSTTVTGTSYTDSNVTSGTTYYYWVTAVNGAAYESAPAGPASASP